ncbi:hypothetical protein ACLQ18_00950 [Streptomyces sp. DT193]|uniref:hypothetical protein n=1 Tax=Streptomyces sp. DT193 TaxID=3393418 RepID=UPI003CF24105
MTAAITLSGLTLSAPARVDPTPGTTPGGVTVEHHHRPCHPVRPVADGRERLGDREPVRHAHVHHASHERRPGRRFRLVVELEKY